MLWASFACSPEAHAKIVSIDTSAAAERPGIRAVFTGEDMADIAARCRWLGPRRASRSIARRTGHWRAGRSTMSVTWSPTAAEVPSFETDRTVTPSPVNSMGVKGVGEAGTIAASAVVTNAVIDAIRPLGVDYMNMPLSPIRVWEAIQDASGSRAEANR
jgi:CO/xanthine dehydrogenase Mo-binding subunit